MFAVDIGVNIFGADTEPPGQLRLEPGGVQGSTGADDPLLRDAGGLVKDIGQHVHRVGDDDIQRLRRGLGDFGGDVPDDAGVGLNQLQPGLSWFPAMPEVMITMSEPAASG